MEALYNWLGGFNMSRITDIISNVRATLSDTKSERWSTTRILQLIDEAQKDICRQSKILRKKVYLNILPGKGEYTLPSDLIRIERVLYKSKLLPAYSHNEMDDTFGVWEDVYGTLLKALVYDKMNTRTVKVYPIPEIDTSGIPIVPLLGLVVSINGFYMQNLLGVLTDLEITEGETQWSEVPFENSLILYYSRYSSKIEVVTDELEIGYVYDKAIEFYVVGKALKDDMETQNRAMSADHFTLYNRELVEAKKDSSKNLSKLGLSTKYLGDE